MLKSTPSDGVIRLARLRSTNMPVCMPVDVLNAPFTVAVSVPDGLISQTFPEAHPASMAPVSLRNVSSGLEKMRLRLVKFPGAMFAVLRNAFSVSSFLTSIRMGHFPERRSTLPGFRVAHVTVTSNVKTVTPAGGASVRETRTCADCGPGPIIGELDEPPQPASKTAPSKPKKKNAVILR